MELKGDISGIITKTKANKFGIVEHVTAIKVEFLDLDSETLSRMALQEHEVMAVTITLE